MSDNITTYVVISGNKIPVPAAAAILDWLAPYRAGLSENQVAKVQNYIGLLVFWNQKISMTSIEDPQEIVCRHFGESFYCSKFLPSGRSRLADVGSGAGFPGLALKILWPELEVFLIEQDTRKAAFLNEVVRLLNLDFVKVLRTHFETMPPDFKNLDIVTARAIGNHKTILKWASPRLSSNGQVILLLGLEDATKAMQVKSWDWSDPAPMPQSRKRVILIGTQSK